MTTEKRKAQLREAQRRHRAKKNDAGWRWLQIPPELITKVRRLIVELEKKVGM